MDENGETKTGKNAVNRNFPKMKVSQEVTAENLMTNEITFQCQRFVGRNKNVERGT